MERTVLNRLRRASHGYVTTFEDNNETLAADGNGITDFAMLRIFLPDIYNVLHIILVK